MFYKVGLTCVVLLVGFLNLSSAQQVQCQTCLPNRAYCVDENTFNICLDANTPTGTLHSCPTNTSCTNSPNICEPNERIDGQTIVKPCQGSCGRCESGDSLVCVSATEFGICSGGDILATDVCPDEQFCSNELYETSGYICAPTCVLEFHELKPSCDVDVVPTSGPGTEPNEELLKQLCWREFANQAGNPYYYIRNINDASCRSYIYCEWRNNDMAAVLFNCNNGYYDTATQTCVSRRPANC